MLPLSYKLRVNTWTAAGTRVNKNPIIQHFAAPVLYLTSRFNKSMFCEKWFPKYTRCSNRMKGLQPKAASYSFPGSNRGIQVSTSVARLRWTCLSITLPALSSCSTTATLATVSLIAAAIFPGAGITITIADRHRPGSYVTITGVIPLFDSPCT